MSPHEPQHSGEPVSGQGTSGQGKRGSLRKLPGFTVAAVAFVMIVILGVGGTAIAKWNQSASVTIDITAGAAPTPTVPSAGAGNIIVNPVIAVRPLGMNADSISCTNAGNGRYTFQWEGDPASDATYVVSVEFKAAAAVFQQTQTVTQKSAVFTLTNSEPAYGDYLLRIQPMKGSVAGDPIYRTLQHSAQLKANCFWAAPKSLLGPFAVSAVPADGGNTNNVLNLSWAASAKATIYKVSIKAQNSSYGTEFTTASLGATLIFPLKALDQSNHPVEKAAFFGLYDLRIQPMNGTQAGDPVYKTVQYQAYNMNIW